jgi:hypothetical protein
MYIPLISLAKVPMGNAIKSINFMMKIRENDDGLGNISVSML